MDPQAKTGTPADLVPAVIRGDGEAVDTWYRLEWPVVYRLGFGFLANAAEALDLAQDAMLHLLDHLGDWNPGRSYPAWRTAVVANLCRDRLRRLATRQRAESSEALLLPQRLPAPDAGVEAEETRTILVESLGALTPREREVFVLHDLEGASYAEVAESLTIQQSTARTLVTLARRRLRKLLGPRLTIDDGGRHG
ncbi:MAG: hypothetical protein CMJ83_11345 [Planctomycetes bacterium]|nr:hypothetical protein [Planctomycetota bacterium]